MRVFITIIMCVLFLHCEDAIDSDIQNTQSIDELTHKMYQAPKQYRHRYIQAIKERTLLENQERRTQVMQMLNEKNAEETANEQINALTGRGSRGNAWNSNGHGSGGGHGGGGNGGGGGGGR